MPGWSMPEWPGLRFGSKTDCVVAGGGARGHVLADGFEFEGRPYRSLSAVARHITGTRWNGWTFFGLKGQGRGA